MEIDQEQQFQTRIVIPGDVIREATETNITLGPGLRQEGEHIVATKAGILKHLSPGKWWIESNQKRYIASTGESVVGRISNRLTDYYRVDIGTAHSAILPALAFEGATKRNKPSLSPGDLVYCRVAMANRDMEAELECVNPTTGKADGFGVLKGGFVIKCSLGLCRRLLVPTTMILRLLGEQFPFEMAVGMNGRVWINSNSVKDTIMLANAIQNSEYLDDDECKAMVHGLLAKA